MPTRLTNDAAHLVDPSAVETIDVLGPTVQYLTPCEAGDDTPCVLRGSIPPGGFVPLHSHADPETFIVLSGEFDGLGQGFEWIRITAGDIFHVPGGVKHAFRNTTRDPAVSIIATTCRIGAFFREVGAPLGKGGTTAWPPPDAVLQRFLEAAERYGYGTATPEENSAVGLSLGG
jgi:Cupin domain